MARYHLIVNSDQLYLLRRAVQHMMESAPDSTAAELVDFYNKLHGPICSELENDLTEEF